MDKRPKVDLIIDAIFGIGLSRHLSPEIVELLEILNENSQAKRVAIDIPTGISTNTGELLPIAFKADVTITFARKKPGQLLLPGKLYCGEIICDNIGISDKIIQEVEPYIIENNIALWSEYLPIPKMDAHKYQRGMVAVIGGGAESSGAARMAAIAAARAGAGVVKVYCPLEAREIYASTLLSVMVESFVDHRDLLQKIRDNIKISAIIVGPGLGKVGNSDLIIKLLESRIPIVLDADALTIFEGNSEVLFNNIHSSVIMTPHAGEFRKLFGEYSDKLSACFAAATQSGATIVSKGSDTIIANSEFAVINTNSKPTLATAGSGDVLTGIISGLLAFNQQKCETRQISLDHLKMGNIIKIACLAVTIHSECANKLGFGIIAEDLLDAIPQVITDSNSKQ